MEVGCHSALFGRLKIALGTRAGFNLRNWGTVLKAEGEKKMRSRRMLSQT